MQGMHAYLIKWSVLALAFLGKELCSPKNGVITALHLCIGWNRPTMGDFITKSFMVPFTKMQSLFEVMATSGKVDTWGASFGEDYTQWAAFVKTSLTPLVKGLTAIMALTERAPQGRWPHIVWVVKSRISELYCSSRTCRAVMLHF